MVRKRTQEEIELVRSHVIMTLLQVVRLAEMSFYTYNHCDRVAGLARLIGNEYGLPKQELSVLWRAALLHDVGKIGVGRDVILSPKRISEEQYNTVKKHPEWGEEIVRSSQFLKNESLIIRHHHEHYNGNGYPDGLVGKDISIYSRIISVADVFDSLVNERPYSFPWPYNRAADYIMGNSNEMFDPTFVDIFLRIFRTDNFYLLYKEEK